jgi:ribonucleoside-diphosphate reductase alpha chain
MPIGAKRAFPFNREANQEEIDMQVASLDIWDRKYRLKTKDGQPVDQTLEDTYRRVAATLAKEEAPEQRDHWLRQFIWALHNGAIPAGRIISNAGAQNHKPATSTINCTVSGTIRDSMDDILQMVYQGGLTLRAGCGIGYEFSTLRPKGAFVAGAGASTSGPLSFMDIFDSMCRTISSAGGRRGAQMATFDIAHPDILEFIRAKREDGRLRQFNLSCLITEPFMEAVKHDLEWELVFPANRYEWDNPAIEKVYRPWPVENGYHTNDCGEVACRVYKRIKARVLWDAIMRSNYAFAEPGFILIDRVNQMNNLWWCENIRATNPCVTADTWIHTNKGPCQVSDLIGKPFQARLDGDDHDASADGFFLTGTKPVFKLTTLEGMTLRLTANHRLRRVRRFTRSSIETEWKETGQLRPGDRLLLADHRDQRNWSGPLDFEEGLLLGTWLGGGMEQSEQSILAAWKPQMAQEGGGAFALLATGTDNQQRDRTINLVYALSLHHEFSSWLAFSDNEAFGISLARLSQLTGKVGLTPAKPGVSAAMEQSSSAFHQGFLQGFFDVAGQLRRSDPKGPCLTATLSDPDALLGIQRMLMRLGVVGRILTNGGRSAYRLFPDGKGGRKASLRDGRHAIEISGENLRQFETAVGFSHPDKAALLRQAIENAGPLARERFTVRVAAIEPDGEEPVYDVQIPGINAFDANGLYAHNCGEQPLPAYGACLLGSINLTQFVRDPFSSHAGFDWERFREVVRIFTRMLDNVVETHGLPLKNQAEEITRKRRHGMGFLGLGSTLAMMGMRYGDDSSVAFTENVAREMAITGWETGVELAREKGPAPIMEEMFTLDAALLAQRPALARAGYKVGDRLPGRVLLAHYSHYMAQLPEELRAAVAEHGSRFTHHTSIAPTGTIALSLANNASNGIEPSFAHKYSRNIIREGRKTKEKVDVLSFELLAYRTLVNPNADPDAKERHDQLPETFVDAATLPVEAHLRIQAAAQKWIDSSISKTINVPTDYPFERFKDIYMQGYEQGLKGCTTFRYNPEAFQGVLVKEQDLANTTYRFTLHDGEVLEVKGNEEILYDGEVHTAANLFDALKEGYYGKL